MMQFEYNAFYAPALELWVCYAASPRAVRLHGTSFWRMQ